MTDITTEQIVEAGARALCEAQNPGDSWRDFDGSSYQAWLKGCATAALEAMLPLIRKQLADEVRGQEILHLPGDSISHADRRWNIAIEHAARLIEGVES